ncbi:uncharacterized protein LOC142325627 isoform X1 [Lycorma delicatula]|uniref:uncharacterized protein LOC142325627 isoform X1 n=1 Tax=Lycorma delicatula TaxID=130591 RepID=UPI003F50D640
MMLEYIVKKEYTIYIYFINIILCSVNGLNLFQINKKEDSVSYFDILTYKPKNSKENNIQVLNKNVADEVNCKNRYGKNVLPDTYNNLWQIITPSFVKHYSNPVKYNKSLNREKEDKLNNSNKPTDISLFIKHPKLLVVTNNELFLSQAQLLLNKPKYNNTTLYEVKCKILYKISKYFYYNCIKNSILKLSSFNKTEFEKFKSISDTKHKLLQLKYVKNETINRIGYDLIEDTKYLMERWKLMKINDINSITKRQKIKLNNIQQKSNFKENLMNFFIKNTFNIFNSKNYIAYKFELNPENKFKIIDNKLKVSTSKHSLTNYTKMNNFLEKIMNLHFSQKGNQLTVNVYNNSSASRKNMYNETMHVRGKNYYEWPLNVAAGDNSKNKKINYFDVDKKNKFNFTENNIFNYVNDQNKINPTSVKNLVKMELLLNDSINDYESNYNMIRHKRVKRSDKRSVRMMLSFLRNAVRDLKFKINMMQHSFSDCIFLIEENFELFLTRKEDIPTKKIFKHNKSTLERLEKTEKRIKVKLKEEVNAVREKSKDLMEYEEQVNKSNHEIIVNELKNLVIGFYQDVTPVLRQHMKSLG